MEQQIFELHGYHLDFYIGRSYVGFIRMQDPDRDVFGYSGRQQITLTEDVAVERSNGTPAILKAGSDVKTECVPICGRIKGDWKDRIDTLKQHYLSAPYKRRFQ